jgi:hypothetical protein
VLQKELECWKLLRSKLVQVFQLLCARRYVGASCDEVEIEKFREGLATCERAIKLKAREALKRYRAVKGWMETALLFPGPEEEKARLAPLIDELNFDSGPSSSAEIVARLSPEECLAVLRHAGTETDQKIINRILSLLESDGPLVTEKVLKGVGERSSTRVKDLLSRLHKIKVIENGPGGYTRPLRSKDQSKD